MMVPSFFPLKLCSTRAITLSPWKASLINLEGTKMSFSSTLSGTTKPFPLLVHHRVPETRFISLGIPYRLFFSSTMEPSRTRFFKSCLRVFPCFLLRERMATSSLGASGFFSFLKILRRMSFVSSSGYFFFISSSNKVFSFVGIDKQWIYLWLFCRNYLRKSSSVNVESTYLRR